MSTTDLCFPMVNEKGSDINSSDNNADANVNNEDGYFSELDRYRRVLALLSKNQLIELLAVSCVAQPEISERVLSVVYESRSHRRLYIKNLPFTVSTQELIQTFEQFGSVEEGIVLERNGKSRGYAFVTFKTLEATKEACRQPIYIHGRRLMVKLAADPFSSSTSGNDDLRKKLFVRNLGFNSNENSLVEAFKSYGELQESVVLRNKHGESRGYGFVTFKNNEDAVKVLQQPHHIVDGRLVFVHHAIQGKARGDYKNKGANKFTNNLDSLIHNESQTSVNTRSLKREELASTLKNDFYHRVVNKKNDLLTGDYLIDNKGYQSSFNRPDYTDCSSDILQYLNEKLGTQSDRKLDEKVSLEMLLNSFFSSNKISMPPTYSYSKPNAFDCYKDISTTQDETLNYNYEAVKQCVRSFSHSAYESPKNHNSSNLWKTDNM